MDLYILELTFVIVFIIVLLFKCRDKSSNAQCKSKGEQGYKATLRNSVEPNMEEFVSSMGYNKKNQVKIPSRKTRKTLPVPVFSTADAAEQMKINQISNEIDDIIENVFNNYQISALENHISNFDDQDDSDDLHENNFSSNDFM